MADTKKQNAGLVLASATLDAFRALEWFVIAGNVLALLSIAMTQVLLCRIASAAAFIIGGAALYCAFRIRLDQKLFASWLKLNPAELDMELKRINPRFEQNRSLESRLSGAYHFIRCGVIAAALQAGILLAMAWFYQ